ncbi:AbrB/MazE/SpoVT family DNA-binding domain-containing protein [Paenibacillus sp. CN-4]|uniref:AbrB/MazE/SpoVT family DNA-binding domain-containing protein n=1 Tax=Paenibacillus nanchangensis TaxID=3348343 RepID=UPI00397D26BA
MKATGIVRKVDELGRIVIPIELRRTMGIDIKDPLEIFVDGEKIILRKYEPTCIFSGSSENLINFKGKMVSRDVLDELVESFKNA